MTLEILMIAALIFGILLGYPVSSTIAGIAVIFAALGWSTGSFDMALMGALGQRVFGLLINEVLIAIPLFVFMGVVLEKSRIAEDLLQTIGPAVRLAPRRARHLGRRGGRAFGRLDRHRRRDGDRDGHDRAADDAAERL